MERKSAKNTQFLFCEFSKSSFKKFNDVFFTAERESSYLEI